MKYKTGMLLLITLSSVIGYAAVDLNTGVYSGLPDKSMTPGAIDLAVTQENLKQTVCITYYTNTVRPPSSYTNKLKKQQILDYKYKNRDPKLYEEDHLIPLAVGGNPTSPLNLWPEPRKNTNWGASKKDRLEVLLHKQLCNGKITLEQAQKAFSDNWIESYKQYIKN